MDNPINGVSVLIVEDEWMIADDFASTLDAAGFNIVGPASNVRDALRLLTESPVSLGLLDLNLGNENSLPIAEALGERDIPFAFITGYADFDFGAAFSDTPRLLKPVTRPQLIALVQSLSATKD